MTTGQRIWGTTQGPTQRRLPRAKPTQRGQAPFPPYRHPRTAPPLGRALSRRRASAKDLGATTGKPVSNQLEPPGMLPASPHVGRGRGSAIPEGVTLDRGVAPPLGLIAPQVRARARARQRPVAPGLVPHAERRARGDPPIGGRAGTPSSGGTVTPPASPRPWLAKSMPPSRSAWLGIGGSRRRNPSTRCSLMWTSNPRQ